VPTTRFVVGLIALGLLVASPLAWQWAPLREWVDLEELIEALKALGHRPATISVVLAAFRISGSVMLPTTVVVLVTVFIFGPWLGFVYALLGCTLSAMTFYGLGRMVQRQSLSRVLGAHLDRVMSMLRGNEVFAVAMVNWSQLVNLTLSGLAAGALRIHFRRYLAGTLLALLENRLEVAIRAPELGNMVALIAIAVLWVLGVFWGTRKMKQAWNRTQRPGSDEGPRQRSR
jgi:phospholipase D1/2